MTAQTGHQVGLMLLVGPAGQGALEKVVENRDQPTGGIALHHEPGALRLTNGRPRHTFEALLPNPREAALEVEHMRAAGNNYSVRRSGGAPSFRIKRIGSQRSPEDAPAGKIREDGGHVRERDASGSEDAARAPRRRKRRIDGEQRRHVAAAHHRKNKPAPAGQLIEAAGVFVAAGAAHEVDPRGSLGHERIGI